MYTTQLLIFVNVNLNIYYYLIKMLLTLVYWWLDWAQFIC